MMRPVDKVSRAIVRLMDAKPDKGAYTTGEIATEAGMSASAARKALAKMRDSWPDLVMRMDRRFMKYTIRPGTALDLLRSAMAEDRRAA